MGTMEEDLKNLSAVSSRLGAATDALDETVAGLEEKLTNAPRVSVWLDVLLDEEQTEDEKGRQVREGYRLGYAKVQSGAWRIAVKRSRQEFDRHGDAAPFIDTDHPTALASAPREVRAEAAPHIEDVVQALSLRAAELLEGVERANEVVGT